MFDAYNTMNYAGFGRRLVAKIIDIAIVTTLNYSFALAFEGHTPLDHSTYMSMVPLIGLLFNIGYNAAFLERFGATPGKFALSIRVVKFDGEPIGAGRALARPLAEYLSSCLYIGYLMALGDNENRTLHDRMCNTRVIVK